MPTPFAAVVAASTDVAATRARSTKVARLCALLAAVDPGEIESVVGFLVGAPRQGRVGVGWASVYTVDAPAAATASLTVADVDAAITAVETMTGSGSQARRAQHLHALFARATASEQDFLRRLFTGELRQGALAGIMTDAIARATGVPLATVRRAAMLDGDLGRTACLARTGGAAALETVGLRVLHAVAPMLAAPAPTVHDALERAGGLASIEWKLDGIRVQVHRDHDDVRVFTRNLHDITERVPEIVAIARGVAADRFVVDGEALGIVGEERLHAYFFDVLHAGADLIDAPLRDRRAVLESLHGLPRVPALTTDDADAATAFTDEALRTGHEGVVVKSLDAPYEAGRRGGSWRKVKPVKTLDLVVIAAEWGHGRRRGWLSNLHLGARGPDGTFVMVGKTFKGMTDALLAWQTEQLLARRIGEEGITVHVAPELVVEIALDGVLPSKRYVGGVALRFARVRRYRDDKRAADADTIETVQALVT